MSDPPRPLSRRPARGGWLGALIAALAGVALLAAMASLALGPREQALFAVLTAALFLACDHAGGRRMSFFLIALSAALSVRYIVWRVTETLPSGGWAEFWLGLGLALAELYAILVLLLGYLRTAWPPHRPPLPLPADPRDWPKVDVFIPTYNEPIGVVRATLLAAMAMDYPRDKLSVHLLDDGRREEFRHFAEEAGCGYIDARGQPPCQGRQPERGAAADQRRIRRGVRLRHDPDAGVPATGARLAGRRGPRVAVVQTPHHSYSPDPFQRNLAAGTRVPAEGNMFHGLAQDGGDFWNATLFCGSCAILRRAALDSVGGFAVETVTEDAHTMLRLHRRGWERRVPAAAARRRARAGAARGAHPPTGCAGRAGCCKSSASTIRCFGRRPQPGAAPLLPATRPGISCSPFRGWCS